MFKPWITLPAADVKVQFPMNMLEGEINIMFKDPETIDNAIAQLENLKSLYGNSDGLQQIIKEQGV